MARRQLLTDEERQALLGIPPDADSLARLFTLSRVDRNLVAERRGDANRLGCAVQLARCAIPARRSPISTSHPTRSCPGWRVSSRFRQPLSLNTPAARKP